VNGAQPTVADVLALPEVQAGQPVVLAGEAGLQRRVRWVHVLELSRVEGLLRGGELVMTTGVALPTSNDELRRYIDDLDHSRTSGVLLQLGERWTTPPPALVRAADRVGLPLIGLRTEVAFVAITERVHASIVSGSHAELSASERIYDLFSRRGLDAAPARQVVEELAEIVAAPVVFESVNHRVLEAAPAGRDRGNVLGDWERRSRRATEVGEGGAAGPEGWLVRPVTARDEHFGRLVLQPGPGVRPTRLQVLAVEQAAAALALGRLLRAEGPHLERRAHADLLADLVEHRYRTDSEAHLRTQAAGVPTLRHALTGLALATAGPPDRETDLGHVLRAAERARLPVLAAAGRTTVSVLLALPPSDDVDRAVAALADAVRQEVGAREHRVVLGRGPTVTELYDVAAALRDAEHAAVAALHTAAAGEIVTLADVGVHGLLAQWGDDGRLQAYVERQLGPLLDGSAGSAVLLTALRAFLEQGGNKSSAAAALHLSRPALYARLEQVAGRLRADLDDVDVRLSLHVALAAHDALTQ
jgi:purine catabolism regulator